MQRLIDWIRTNKVATILILVIVFLLLKENSFSHKPISFRDYDAADMVTEEYSRPMAMGAPGKMALGEMAQSSILPMPPVDQFPPSTNPDRLVIRDTYVSMLVDDVNQTLRQIETKTKELGGFMVNANAYSPEGAASGSITVRIPTNKRQEALDSFRSLGVKVTSESVNGQDVTDQYEDINAQLQTLNTTKAKFETLLEDAETVEETLQVQREIISLQQQIDSLVGRQQYLEKTAQLALISVQLSTDELALPYAPDGAWRPTLAFKEAVRSLLRNLRELGNTLIWIGVYAIVWIPVLIILWLVYRLTKRLKTKKNV